MEKAKEYLTRFQQAETSQQKQALVGEYQTFLNTLTDTERDQARQVMSSLWPDIRKRVNELEPMMRTLEELTEKIVSQPMKAQ